MIRKTLIIFFVMCGICLSFYFCEKKKSVPFTYKGYVEFSCVKGNYGKEEDRCFQKIHNDGWEEIYIIFKCNFDGNCKKWGMK